MVHVNNLRLRGLHMLLLSTVRDLPVYELAVLFLKRLDLVLVEEGVMLKLPFDLSFLNLIIL